MKERSSALGQQPLALLVGSVLVSPLIQGRNWERTSLLFRQMPVDEVECLTKLESGDGEPQAVAAAPHDGSLQERIATHLQFERAWYGRVGVLQWR